MGGVTSWREFTWHLSVPRSNWWGREQRWECVEFSTLNLSGWRWADPMSASLTETRRHVCFTCLCKASMAVFYKRVYIVRDSESGHLHLWCLECPWWGEPTHFICKSGGFRQKPCTNLKPDMFKECLISRKAQLTWCCHLCVSLLWGSVFLELDKQQWPQ